MRIAEYLGLSSGVILFDRKIRNRFDGKTINPIRFHEERRVSEGHQPLSRGWTCPLVQAAAMQAAGSD
jgi:hypothetical protein